jgi:hypothetical protein
MKKLLCWFFGHQYRLEKNLGFGCQKLRCKRCKAAFGINHQVKALLPWDSELEELHNEINPQP